MIAGGNLSSPPAESPAHAATGDKRETNQLERRDGPEEKMERNERVGNWLMGGFHLLGLFIIGAIIVWATIAEVIHIFQAGGPSIKDFLLLFIYLELAAIVGIYFKTRQLPVRFILYIAITALTRVLGIDIKTMSDERMLMVSVAILVLSLSVLVLRVGSDRFPAESHE